MNFLWLFIVAMVVCSGCKKDFKNIQGLTKHRNTCTLARENTARVLLRREAVFKQKKVEERVRRNARADRMNIDIAMPDLQSSSMAVEDETIDTFAGPSPDRELPPTTSGRRRKFLRHFQDFLPSLSTSLPHMPQRVKTPPPIFQSPSPSVPSPPQESPVPVVYETEPNTFGLYRSYTCYPTHDPEDEQGVDEVCDAPGLATAPNSQSKRWWIGFGSVAQSAEHYVYAPFLNATVFRLMNWFYGGSNMKSMAELDALVDNVLLAQDFNVEHLHDFSAARELKRLDGDDSQIPTFSTENGWMESSVKIRLPAEGMKYASEGDAPEFEVHGVHHRSLVEVIRTAFQDVSAKSFHYTPFRLFWRPTPHSAPERVISEMYNSDAFLEEHAKLQAQPREPDCQLETGIAAIMLWSDVTHLTSFGMASLWPIYSFFGNQSKYARAKPTNFAAHHVAYIPAIPATLQDQYTKIFNGLPASADTLTHLKRELMHAIWELLLDAEFMEAYEHGIVVECADGIWRRLFPRFFTYSADYPEKILLATVRYLGNCPCPRCFIQKDQIGALGTTVDTQRRGHTRIDDRRRQAKVELTRTAIFEKGLQVTSAYVERILQPTSMVPTRNAFSTRLSKFGFDYHPMFVPDLLHEFELGVWKAVFTHLVRILYAAGGDRVQTLNRRYRQVPTFGRGTIRRFSNNASAMRKLAARDFEDLLQCAIPVFEGLLPALHNEIVLDLLFELCTWHAFAKLRLHTKSTLQLLKESTTALGQVLRHFIKKTCSSFVTRELPQEGAARGRRKAADVAKGKSRSKGKQKEGPLTKLFNMCTYKLHALGDYVESIWQYGTTDSYSTQPGELEHRRVKRFYSRTNKLKFTRQITKHQHRERILRKIWQRSQQKFDDTTGPLGNDPTFTSSPATSLAQSPPWQQNMAALSFEDEEALAQTSPTDHHHVSNSRRYPENIIKWLTQHAGDPAFTNFLPDLKDHILSCLLGHAFDGDERLYSDDDRNTVQFDNNRIYRHKVIRINYTTYDMRRSQDSINPRTHPDIMTLSHEDDVEAGESHPYWYARVIGVFHAEVRHAGPSSSSNDPAHMDFLWVRWFGRDLSYHAGWTARRLHRVGFVEGRGAFGFLDPADVIQGVHLIPAFAHGTTSEMLRPSIARQPSENDEDWRYYYVAMFADRDMVMRFRGGGIGHKATHAAKTFTASQSQSPRGTNNAAEPGDEYVEHPDNMERESDPGDHETEEEDYGYGLGDHIDDDDEEEELTLEGDGDLGPEDGEEGWDNDEVHAAGFAEL